MFLLILTKSLILMEVPLRLEWDWFTSNMPYGERWKKHRQQLHPFLEPSSVKKYVDRQTRDARMLLRSLLDSPEDFLAHIRK